VGRDLPPYVSANRRGTNPLWPARGLERVPVREQSYLVGCACVGLTAVGLEFAIHVLVGLWLVQVVVGLVGMFFTE
jgi:hypothetical protein